MNLGDFDPDGPGGGEGLFGIPCPLDQALVRVIPVPWEATASYGRGTRSGPEAVLAASMQVDLDDVDFGTVWKAGIALVGDGAEIAALDAQAEGPALDNIGAGGDVAEAIVLVDALSERVNALVYAAAKQVLQDGAIPAVLGGDHSAPYGLIRAVAERYPGVGILHVDAHADLRDAFLGFRWSHASIHHNSLELPGVGRLVGVGYRDIGGSERARIAAEPQRIRAHFDHQLSAALMAGDTWASLAAAIVADLPPDVYISFDIDGLCPTLCPNTGTPVPGGLSFAMMQLLLRELAAQRNVVGFDLCEVSPGPAGVAPPARRRSSAAEWDANVGARVLYKLCGCAATARARVGRPTEPSASA
jgi:agmatinase